MRTSISSLLKRWRVCYLLLLGVLTAFFGYHCIYGLEIEKDNRSMDADNVGQMLVEQEFDRLFGSDDSILFAVHKEVGLLDDSGKELIQKLASRLAQMEGVRSAKSLADSDFVVSAALEGLLVSKDRKTCGIEVTLAKFTDDGRSLSATIDGFRGIKDEFAGDGVEIFVSGLSVQKEETNRLIRADQRFFAPTSFLVLGCVLLLTTRRLSGLIIPLLVAAVTICWTMGILALSGHSLNMITSLLQPVIMTLAIATGIHIYVEWLHPLGATEIRYQRIAAAVRNLFRPCLFASLTTAAGFLSLLSSNTPAVRQFGMFAAIGVMIAFVLGVSGLAVGLTFVKAPTTHSKPEDQKLRPGALGRILDGVWQLSVNRSGLVLLVTLLLTVIGFFGMQKVRSNTDLLSYIGDDHSLYRDTRFIDEHLTGVNTVELLINRTDGGKIDSFEQVEQVQSFQNEVDQLTHVSHIISAADGLAAAEFIGFSAQDPDEDASTFLNLDSYLSADQETLRMTVRCNAIGSAQGAKLIDEIRTLSETHLGVEFTMREAGDFYRVVSESNSIVRTQVTSFTIAIVLILIAIGVVFRSFLFMGLAIIPNVIPLLMMVGFMGFADIELSIGTAMIASVVIGVAVDDTIHYLAAFRKNYQGDCREALRITTRSTGFALTSTTLALSLGFWVAIFGSFQPTVHFALLSGLTMWLALTSDLLVLPACLNLVLGRKTRSAT